MNEKILFNDGWKFAKSSLEVCRDNNLEFKEIDIPHDYLIDDSLNFYDDSIGWYKKEFNILDDINEKEFLLCFDGVYMNSSLYVNEKFVGEWKYGYSSFEYDITDKLKKGENKILVKVINQNPNSRWYSGAGIYRDVWLKIREKSHICTNGIYVSTKNNDKNWTVEIETDLKINNNARLIHSLIYDNEVVGKSENIIEVKNTLDTWSNSQRIVIENPLLWSNDEPNLYVLKSELYIKKNNLEEKIECVSQKIGFRNIEFNNNKGLFLNGKHIKINGVCEHHDLGALGSAFNKEALRRRFTLLKEMGVNAIRTSHNMPAPELMNLADEMGFLILSEAFDMWEREKNKYDYARFFKDYALTDVKSWVFRDRNHPSLFMWSIGNEIYDTHADERGQEITKMLMDCVHKYDYKENAKVTLASNYMPWENAQKCADIVKVAGYNYGEKYYEEHHKKHSDWIIYGSETGSVVQSRGVYHFPLKQSILADDDEQCSSLGNSSTSWGAKNAEACIISDRDTQFSLGQFIWTGFDYIGEPTPYHTKNSYFGQLDTATFKKDSYYIYKAEWTDYKKSPMIHVFPYWDFNKNQNIDVRVCSNAPRIELKFNDKLVGTFDIDHKNGKKLLGSWNIPYEEGVLKAIAYDENGKVIATDIKRSFKDAQVICLKKNKENIIANGLDVLFVEITMQDENGNIVCNANNRVSVSVSGPGRLIGLDNGDSTDYDSYKGVSRRLFSGKLMAIIGSTLEEGNIEIKVSSKMLKDKSIIVKAINGNNNSIPKFMKNVPQKIVMGTIDEIPVRKIEIISDEGQLFSDNKREISVKAKLYPENTSYKEVEWSVVNDSGIKSNIAKIIPNGNYAKVCALGDGEFRVRCISRNGTDKVNIISELEYKSNGIGIAYKNPYELISAGLYDFSMGEVGNGNDRGVSSMREGKTIIGFKDIDFGEYGSDIITIPIFALDNKEYCIQIFEGDLDEGNSKLIADVKYQKESIWNVYQEETYTLNKRLKGITSIYFVVYAKFHIKGFKFEKINRALNKNYGSDCSSIYGDTFKLHKDSVQGIGNNVSLVFDNMDFKEEGVSKVRIYGNSPIDKNTINIQFDSKKGSKRQIIEFPHTNEYEEKVFNLEKVKGLQKVTLLFLPGSNFDFGWVSFEK